MSGVGGGVDGLGDEGVRTVGEQSGVAQRIIFTIDMTVDSDIFYFTAQDL